MPYTSYALFKAIRSHQISSPKVEPSARFGTPNACNLCHLDKTLAWSQEKLSDGTAKKQVTLSDEQQNTPPRCSGLSKDMQPAGHRRMAHRLGAAQKASGKDWLARLRPNCCEIHTA
jgi:hypothetical protein